MIGHRIADWLCHPDDIKHNQEVVLQCDCGDEFVVTAMLSSRSMPCLCGKRYYRKPWLTTLKINGVRFWLRRKWVKLCLWAFPKFY